MNDIYDSNQKLVRACDDLRAVKAIISAVEDHPEDTAEKAVLAVTRRALEPIIDDIQEVIDTIDNALIRMKKEHVQQGGSGILEAEAL